MGATGGNKCKSDRQENRRNYDALGLPSNDPNTIADQAAATIGRAFVIYSEEFFASVIANLASLGGLDLASVVRTLTDGFQMPVDAASEFVTNAGYTLKSWVDGLGNILTQALDFSCVVEVSNQGGPYELVRTDYAIGSGTWAIEPPERIPPGGVGRFWLKDPKPTPYGQFAERQRRRTPDHTARAQAPTRAPRSRPARTQKHPAEHASSHGRRRDSETPTHRIRCRHPAT